jgi:hypothetical protein
LLQVGPGGVAIEGELWSTPAAAVSAFLGTIAPPLGLGTALLDGCERCFGFICEGGAASNGARDISNYGSWRAFREVQGRKHECPPGDDVLALT